MTTQTIDQLIIGVMQEEYSIILNPQSIRIVRETGFDVIPDIGKQIDNLNKVQRRIGITIEPNGLVAKIFSLAFAYGDVLAQKDHDFVRGWSIWLATSEYRLAEIEEFSDVSEILYEKSLSHFLEARKHGDNSKDNSAYIGNLYFKKKEYALALSYFEESRARGNIEIKEIPTYIGTCLINIERFEEGVEEYKKALSLAKKNDPDPNWIYAFSRVLENSIEILYWRRPRIPDDIEVELLLRVTRLQDEFKEYREGVIPSSHPATY